MKTDLVRYTTENLSDSSLAELLLAKLNASSNARHDFQSHAQKLLRMVVDLVEFCEEWAQKEAEQRYVNYVREAARQRRETERLTQEASVLRITKS